MEPTLDPPTVAIAEQAHDSCFRIDALAARGHDVQGARAILASEHVVLDEPEAFRAKTIEPCRREREPADADPLDPEECSDPAHSCEQDSGRFHLQVAAELALASRPSPLARLP